MTCVENVRPSLSSTTIDIISSIRPSKGHITQKRGSMKETPMASVGRRIEKLQHLNKRL